MVNNATVSRERKRTHRTGPYRQVNEGNDASALSRDVNDVDGSVIDRFTAGMSSEPSDEAVWRFPVWHAGNLFNQCNLVEL
jgi:hypothetical protein